MNDIHPKTIVDAMLHVCLMRNDADHGDWYELFKMQGGCIPEIIRGETAAGHAAQVAAMTFDEADYLCFVSRDPQTQRLKLEQLVQLPDQLEPHEIQVALYALATCWHITTAPCSTDWYGRIINAQLLLVGGCDDGNIAYHAVHHGLGQIMRIVRLPARPVLWYPGALDLIALLAVAAQQQADNEDDAGLDQSITALDGIITGGGTNGDGSKYRVIYLNGRNYSVTMLDGDILELFEIAENP